MCGKSGVIASFRFSLWSDNVLRYGRINADGKERLVIASGQGITQSLKESAFDANGNNLTCCGEDSVTLTISNVSCLSGLPTTNGTQWIYGNEGSCADKEVTISIGETNDTLTVRGTLLGVSGYMDATIKVPVKLGTVTFTLTHDLTGATGSASINVVLEYSRKDAENDGFILDLRGTEYIIIGFNKEVKGDINIPTAIDNINVTGIGAFAFENCSDLTSVTMSDNIKSIGPAAFSDCIGLKSMTIPSSVTEIHESTFYGCSSLSLVKIEYYGGQCNLTSISNSAFENCINLFFMEIPDSVTRIGNHAFCNCRSFVMGGYNRISIPGGIAYIHENTFSGCKDFTSVFIPRNVTSIGDYAFSDCSGLKSIDISDSVTSISDSAFANCTSLTSIKIPDGITRIHQRTFSNCSSLKSINIPVNVTSIDDYAFSRCSSLTSITIPNTVTSIGNGAFSNCSSLESINIPDSVASIGTNAFLNCSKLIDVSICGKVTSIPSNTFSGCTGLTSINISDSVTSIGECAFYNCSSLTSITIPNSVTSIGICAFSGCKNLTSVTMQGNVISISDDTFANISDAVIFYVCNEKVADLLKAHNIKDTQIKYLPPVSYAAYFQNSGYLLAGENNVYNFSTGDFTLEAWVKPEGAGTIISRKSNEGGVGYGGFLLVLRNDGTIKLATDNGFGFYEIDSVQTIAFDGKWHHIAGVRENGALKLYFDGNSLDGEIRNNEGTPLDVNNGMRLLIGSIDQNGEEFIHYSGFIGDVRVWNISKSQEDILTYMTSKLKGNESGLVGYWNFENKNGQDLSNVRNDMVEQGTVVFVEDGSVVK